MTIYSDKVNHTLIQKSYQETSKRRSSSMAADNHSTNSTKTDTQQTHYQPRGLSDRIAYRLVRFMRFFADVFLQAATVTERLF